MDYIDYIYQKKKLYDSLITYLEDYEQPDEEGKDPNLLRNDDQNLEFLDVVLNDSKEEEIEQFLNLLSIISNNHHRNPGFINKIEKIIQYLKDAIKKALSNYQMYEKFNDNNMFLLLLVENGIFKFDEQIRSILKDDHKYFFYPEIKNMLSDGERETIEENILDLDLYIFLIFSEKRRIGENDNQLCSIIRNDSIDEFLSYQAEKKISFDSKINHSIFETNYCFLENKTISLIEYATFFGSVQIFHYLRTHGVKLQPSLWKLAIHSKSLEILQYLIENDIEPNFEPKEEDVLMYDKSYIELSIDDKRDLFYQSILEEAVKSHHNDIANYIMINLINKDAEKFDDERRFYKNILSYAFHYHNYPYFPDDLEDINFVFLYACQFGYLSVVEMLLETGNININAKIIPKLSFLITFQINFLKTIQIFLSLYRKSFEFKIFNKISISIILIQFQKKHF